MSDVITPVVLAGGRGTRLWPASRSDHPKQFTHLAGGGYSLLQGTLARVAPQASGGLFSPALIMAEEAHRFVAREQAEAAVVWPAPETIVLEPEPLGTALTILVAAEIVLRRRGETATIMTIPSDHLVADATAFYQAARCANVATVKTGAPVLFGAPPSGPVPGYGYVRASGSIEEGFYAGREVTQFIEKPPRELAQGLLEQGGWYWNCGLIVVRVGDILRIADPDLVAEARRLVDGAAEDLGVFLRLPSPGSTRWGTIDTELLERGHRLVCIPVEMGWSDVGTWPSLWRALPHEDDGTVRVGDVVVEETRDSYVHSDGPLVATLGVRDLVIYAGRDAVLVASRERAGDMRALVERLRDEDHPQLVSSERTRRPWGWYQTVDRGPGFLVKRITVRPGGRLSLQSHRHRAEHWVVVRGEARVTRGESVTILTANQSTYIPAGETHRLENLTADPLEVVEVQTGAYLGEDDIFRVDDVYGRA